MTDLTGRVAVVTGGGGGIGSAICARLAGAGMHIVIAVAQQIERAEAVANSLSGSGHLAVRARVDDSAELATLAALVEREYGRLDVLVNGAGVTKPVPHADLVRLDDDTIDRIFRVNVRGALAATRALLPLLQRSQEAVIVNISSVAGTTGLGSNVAYCASKAAMDSVTRSLARALAPGIRVVSVAPGWVLGDYAAKMPAEVVEFQRAATPLGRLASPMDVAEAVEAVLHLRMMTGAVLPVDGGRPLGV